VSGYLLTRRVAANGAFFTTLTHFLPLGADYTARIDAKATISVSQQGLRAKTQHMKISFQNERLTIGFLGGMPRVSAKIERMFGRVGHGDWMLQSNMGGRPTPPMPDA
jgi:hypothetical protein